MGRYADFRSVAGSAAGLFVDEHGSIPIGSTLRMTLMTKFLAIASAVFGLAMQPAVADTISISCSALGKEYELCKSGAQAWAQKTGNDVRFVSTPNSATDRLALYLQMMAAQSPDIDV